MFNRLGKLLFPAMWIGHIVGHFTMFDAMVGMTKGYIDNTAPELSQYTEELLWASTVTAILGCLLTALTDSKLGPFLLFAFLVPTTAFAHRFWELPEADQMPEMLAFMRNVSLIGATLVMMGANNAAPQPKLKKN